MVVTARSEGIDIGRLLILGLGGLVLTGCGLVGPDTKTRIGVLFSDAPANLERVFVTPDSVMVGEAFTVLVITEGNGSCTKAGTTHVDIKEGIATITPYDIHKIGGNCTAILSAVRHEATVVFTQRGQATILLRIRRTPSSREPFVMSRTVRVY